MITTQQLQSIIKKDGKYFKYTDIPTFLREEDPQGVAKQYMAHRLQLDVGIMELVA